MKIGGKVWRFGDDINTDLIFPNKYKHVVLDDAPKAAQFAMVGADPDFPKKISKGDIIVAGKNFGCGSSREYAPLSLKYAGVGAVIAQSFARIFFRNAINIGLPPLICAAADKILQGDFIQVDLEKGAMMSQQTQEIYRFTPIPAFLYRILDSGGLIELAKVQLAREALKTS